MDGLEKEAQRTKVYKTVQNDRTKRLDLLDDAYR